MDIQITSNASGTDTAETGMMGLPVGGSSEVESDTYIEEKFASMLDDSLVEAVLEDGDITTTMGEDLVAGLTETDTTDDQELEITPVSDQGEQTAPILTIVETTEGTEGTGTTETVEPETDLSEQSRVKQLRTEPLHVLDENSGMELDDQEEGQHQSLETDQTEPDQTGEQIQKSKAVETTTATSKLELVKEDEKTVEQRQSSAIETFDESFPEGWETLLDDDVPPSDGEKNMKHVTTNDHGQQDEPMTNAMEKESKQPSLLDYGKAPSQQSEQQSQLQSKAERVEGGSQAVIDAELAATEFVEQQPQLKEPMTQPLRPVTTAAQVLEQMSQVQKQSVIKHFTQETIQGLHGKEELLKIELRPPELGRVDMMVQKSGDSVHAKIIIADANVGEFFQENMDQLRKNIEASGLKLGDLTVEIKQENDQSQVDEETEPSDDKQGSFGASDEKGSKSTMKSRMHVNNQQLSKVDMLI